MFECQMVLFHARGPATANARSPIVERRVEGTTRSADVMLVWRTGNINSIQSLSHQPIFTTLGEMIDADKVMGHFTFWISLSLRPKTETKPLNFGLSPEFKLTNHARRTSLLTP